jgi:hypothetical protein
MDAEQAKQITDRLDEAGVPYTIVTEKPLMDEIYIGANYEPSVVLKLNAGDFLHGHAALEAYYSNLLTHVESDYYLLGFSDTELMDVVAKPDEWNTFDYLLAKKLLLERNTGVDENTVQRLKDIRQKELSKTESTPWMILIIGYLIVAGGAWGLWDLLNGRFNPLIWPLLISAFLGMHIRRSSKVLPDGTSVFAYSKKTRQHGHNIFYASLVLIFFGFIAFFSWLGKTYGQ